MSEIRALSERLEDETGFDSIPTIEEKYDLNENGNYVCPFPGCRFVRNDSEAMWKHVHFGPHGRSFGVPRAALLEGSDE